jgi:hypothetical protein
MQKQTTSFGVLDAMLKGEEPMSKRWQWFPFPQGKRSCIHP